MDNTKGLAFFGRGGYGGGGWAWEDQEVGEIGIHGARFPNNQLKTNLKRIANDNSQLTSVTLFPNLSFSRTILTLLRKPPTMFFHAVEIYWLVFTTFKFIKTRKLKTHCPTEG